MGNDMASERDDLWHEADDHINHGRFDKTIEIYRYILVRYSDNNLANEYANAHLGEILLMLGQTDLAENHVRKALSYDPQNPRYHSLLGFVYYIRHEWENAVKEYKLALDREPWNREYLRALGEATFNSGDRKNGMEYLHKVAPLYPNNSGMLTELATAYLAVGDIQRARLFVVKAVKTNPEDVMAEAVLRKIQSFAKNTRQTKDRLTRAKLRTPYSPFFAKVYQFNVSLRGQANVWRVIEIKESQLLSSLHRAISQAFGRTAKHFYTFLANNAPCYIQDECSLPQDAGHIPVRYGGRMRIGNLNLQLGEKLLYLLLNDGEEFWHEAKVVGLRYEVPRAKYPRVMQGNDYSL